MSRTTDYINTDRQMIYNRGNDLNQQAQDRGNTFDERAGFYQGAADDHYIDLLTGGAGYNENERNDILNRDRLTSMYLRPEQEQEAYLRPEEYAGIRGNPNSRLDYYNPNGDLQAVQGREGASRGILDQYGKEMNGSIDPSKLGISSEYSSRMGQAIDPSRIRMTPEQQDAMLRSVARDSTALGSAEIARNMDAIRAAGADPLGAASYSERASRKSRQDMNRALADARVQTDNARADREKTIADLTMRGAQAHEDTRLNAERGITDRRMDASRTVNNARLNFEDQAAGRDQNQRQFNTQVGTGIAGDMENQRTEAERYVAANRQNVQQRNRDDAYDRQKYVDAAVSQRTAGIGDTRRADQQQGRQYLVDQQNKRIDAGQRERDRQLGIYGTQVQGATASTGAQQTQDNQPKWWEKAIGAVSTAASAIPGLKALSRGRTRL